MWRIVVALLLLASCGKEPDCWIGTTAIYLEPGAELQVPMDFTDGFAGVQLFFAEHEAVTEGVLVLFPSDAEMAGGDYNGITQGSSVGVRLLGDSVLDTALVHEYAAHSACRVMYGDGNASHANETCRQMEVDAGNYVQMILEKE